MIPGNIFYKIACSSSKRVQRRLTSACASAQSDQSLRCLPAYALDTSLPLECPAKTDQTVRMRRLTCVFAERTCDLVENAVLRFEYQFLLPKTITLTCNSGTGCYAFLSTPTILMSATASVTLYERLCYGQMLFSMDNNIFITKH